MALMEALSTLGAMPWVDEAARGFIFHCAADCEFHIAHRTPREVHCIPGPKIGLGHPALTI